MGGPGRAPSWVVEVQTKALGLGDEPMRRVERERTVECVTLVRDDLYLVAAGSARVGKRLLQQRVTDTATPVATPHDHGLNEGCRLTVVGEVSPDARVSN